MNRCIPASSTSAIRWWLVVAGLVVGFGSGCASSEPAERLATPEPTRVEADTSAADPSPTPLPPTPTATPTPTDELGPRREIVPTSEAGLLEPGQYRSGLLPVEVVVDTTATFDVLQAENGKIVIADPDRTDGFYGVGLFEIDTLVDSDTNGRQRSRLPATADLREFLSTRDEASVVSSGTGTIGTRDASWWRVSTPDSCDGCWEALHGTAGWSSIWGNLAGHDQQIWAIEAAGALLLVSVEAPTATFDDFLTYVDTHLFRELRFGANTGNTLQRPDGEPYGPHAVGRMELIVTDENRSVEAIERDGQVVVPASEVRELLLSVVYPSPDGGHGAAISPGPHPLLFSAHALFDAGLSLPLERLLASHGYIVVTTRFPESSFPGGQVTGVLNQPADISFVIDEVLAGALGPAISEAMETGRIGVVGASGGATTVVGLTSAECCLDQRIGAAVAHGATPYDFDARAFGSGGAVGSTPVLHVASLGDTTSPPPLVRELHDRWEGESVLAVLSQDAHLGWLDPTAASYSDVALLTVAFFDRHLRDAAGDLAVTVAGGPFETFEQRGE